MSWVFKQHPRKLGYVDGRNDRSDFGKAQVLLKAKLLLELNFADRFFL